MHYLQKIFSILLLTFLLCSCNKSTEREIYSSIEDLKGKKVAVCVGGTQDHFLEKNYPEIIPFRVDGTSDFIAPLLIGQASAALADGILAELMIRNNPNLCTLGEPVYTEYFGMGFKDENLRLKFNAFLSELRESGQLQEICQKWENDDETAMVPSFDYNRDNGTLSIMTDVAMPMVYIKNGKYCGIDIEILSKFCFQEGYIPNFSITSFASSLAAMVAKKADIICGGITITEERKQKIAFSDPYYLSYTTLVINKKNSPNYLESDTSKPNTLIASIKDSIDKNLVKEDRYLIIIDGFKTTIIVSIMASILGTLLGGLICFMKMCKNKFCKLFAQTYIEIIRGIPQVVLLMLMFYVVFASSSLDGVIVAIITFAINFASYSSEIFYTAILGVDKGQTEAGIALGFSKIRTFFYIISPQAIKHALPLYKAEIVSLVKMTSIIGYIAVQDLTKASDIIRSRTFDAFFPLIFIAVIYFLLAYLFSLLLTLIGKKYERTN